MSKPTRMAVPARKAADRVREGALTANFDGARAGHARSAGKPDMDTAAFAAWLNGIQLLDPTQRRRALQELALDETNHPVKHSDNKVDDPAQWRRAEVTLSVTAEPTADIVPEPKLLSEAAQDRPAHPECPHCGGHDIRSWGKAGGRPRSRCTSCQKTFNALTGTPLSHLQYRDRWKDQIQALIDGEPLAKVAERCNVNYTTAFRWRHRFLAAFSLGKVYELPGISAADGALILESFENNRSNKGRRSDLPGKSREWRGGAGKGDVSGR